MLPKHSEQRCGSSRSRRLPEGKDTEGNIYRRRGRRAKRINISALGPRAAGLNRTVDPCRCRRDVG